MPYITEERKEFVDAFGAETAGELNYAITEMICNYLPKDCSYADLNDVIGALEGAKLEFYRRVVVPYEQEKIRSNGDVYDV